MKKHIKEPRMSQNAANFTDTEIAIICQLVSRTHTNNAMSGKGNSREMSDLMRKLDAMSDGEGDDE